MIIDFDKIEEESLPHFKGGEKEMQARMYFDGLNRIMKGRLHPGASIGYHKHENGSEVIFVTRGHGHVKYDDRLFAIGEGDCHYCPKGHSHSLINDSDADLEFTAVVPQQ